MFKISVVEPINTAFYQLVLRHQTVDHKNERSPTIYLYFMCPCLPSCNSGALLGDSSFCMFCWCCLSHGLLVPKMRGLLTTPASLQLQQERTSFMPIWIDVPPQLSGVIFHWFLHSFFLVPFFFFPQLHPTIHPHCFFLAAGIYIFRVIFKASAPRLKK